MEYSKDGLHMTEQFEGCNHMAYKDARGTLTIGYGHTAGVLPNMMISQDQAEAFLMQDIQNAAATVNKLVKVPLTQAEFDALTDFVFNCGSGNFLCSTLLHKLNAGDYAGCSHEFEKWDRCNGQEVAGLLRRRVAETAEFNAGLAAQ